MKASARANKFTGLAAAIDGRMTSRGGYVRYGARDGAARAEFSWNVQDENGPASRRGWAATGTAGRLIGQFYTRNGDDSGFVCERSQVLQ